MENILEIERITKSFGSLKAVDNVSFSIAKGEIFGLVGESGCGKSTLARMITRLVEPDEGSISFEGRDLLNLKSEALRSTRSRLQIVFQDPTASLDPKMTVGEAVAEPFVVHKGARVKGQGSSRAEEVIRLLQNVGLSRQYISRYPHEISGGECQRVCIARAMALNPSFVVLDEPVSSLDYSVQGKIIDLLLTIKRRGNLTYLFITHDLLLAKRLCGRIAVMKNGRIIETGYTEELFASPKESYTRQLIKDAI